MSEQPYRNSTGGLIDRSRPLNLTFNGRSYQGFQGDTLASALLANGVHLVGRSFKYHRPRGLLTASFLDPGCMVQVGDEPNVRGAHRRVEPGMVVSPQNVWPSLRFDATPSTAVGDRGSEVG
jgi:sarcosine oxidase, subunit alpha